MIFPYLIHIPLILWICIYLRKKTSDFPLKKIYWPSLILKFIAGIGVGLLYLYYYPEGGDTLEYKRCSEILTRLLLSHPKEYMGILLHNAFSGELKNQVDFWHQPRALFFCKLLSLINLFTFSNYWISSLYLSLFSFSGLWFLGNQITKIYQLSNYAAALAFLLFPSFVFWSSGLLKESIVVGCICFTLYYFNRFIYEVRRDLSSVFLFLIVISVGAAIKFYYFLVLLPMMLAYALTRWLQRRFAWPQWVGLLSMTILFSTFTIIPLLVYPSLAEHFVKIIYISYTNMLKASHPGGYFTFRHFEPTFTSLLINFPSAVFTGLFRPFPWEIRFDLSMIVGIESMVLILMTLIQLLGQLRTKKSLSLPVYAALLYIVIMAALMSFIAPNWGTLSRYKAGYIMFFALIIFHENPFIELIKRKISGNQSRSRK